MTFPTLTRADVLRHLTNEAGEPLVVLPWWSAAHAAIDNPAILEVLLNLIRQAGKSQFIGAEAVSTVLTVPNAYVVLVAASEGQQQAIYHRKVRRPLERLLRALGLSDLALFTRSSVEIPELNTALEVTCSTEDTTPGRTVTRLFIDEARHVRDEVYAALAPSVIGAGGKVVLASSAGPPRGFFYDLVSTPTEATWLYQSTENENPRASRGVLEFLRRRVGLVSAAAVRRELYGEFADDGDALISWSVIEAAIDDELVEAP